MMSIYCTVLRHEGDREAVRSLSPNTAPSHSALLPLV
uniref:Uncharacterized protein n=1 Tax=Anguilla anguilla TaxID=7936 RepID=A0A0E9S2G4_ANGAN